jgi:hypothetical protein
MIGGIVLVGVVLQPRPLLASTPACVSSGNVCITAADDTSLAGRRVLLLVHGISEGADGWSNFIGFYDSTPALHDKFKIYKVLYSSNVVTVQQLAEGLRDDIDKLDVDPAESGFSSAIISIVGHSMGGLISRSLLRLSQSSGPNKGVVIGERCAVLVTLATPYHGSPLANGPAMEAAAGPGLNETLTLFDKLFWTEFGIWDHPNRADLRWDNYSSIPAYRLDYEAFPFEANPWLLSLNSETTYDSKIVAYAGTTTPGVCLPLCAGAAILSLVFGFASDGAVPLESANFDGNPRVRVHLPSLAEYNHDQMWRGKTDDVLDDVLFQAISGDLQAATSPCALFTRPSILNVTASGSTGDITVVVQSGCAWSASSDSSLLTITGASTGNGSGPVSYVVAANSGMHARGATLTVGGAAFTVVQAGANAALQSKLLAGDAGAAFGRSVAIDGNTAVIGAPRQDVGGNSDQGSAFVFIRIGTQWSQQAQLTAPDGIFFDGFGTAVAISGDTIAVGSPNHAGSRGAVYVFQRTGSTWALQQKLSTLDAAESGELGSSVAMQGNTLVVGAKGEWSVSGISNGAAYVFVRNGTVWTQQQRLIGNNGPGIIYFGNSVAIDADTAVVGAFHANSGTGTATVFQRAGSVWSRQVMLMPGDAGGWSGQPNYFGSGVSVGGEFALIGAFIADGSEVDQGAAYVFGPSGATWTRQEKLVDSEGHSGDRFGASVAISGDGSIGVVGAYSASTDQGHQGAVYVVARAGSTWIQQQRLIAPDTQEMGASVAIGGTSLLLGAPESDGGRGAAFVYTWVVDAAPAIASHPANQGVTTGQNAQFVVAASGTPFPTYQWQVSANSGSTWADLTNVAPYSGVTTTTLTVTAATLGLSGNQYCAVATNTAGTATSNAATITVGTSAAVTTQPVSQTIASGAASTLSVVATGTALSYQWYQGTSGTTTTPIGGATASSYTTAALTSTTSYWVRVSNAFGSPADSTTATLTIGAPQLTTPAPGATLPGSTVTFQWTGVGGVSQYVLWVGAAPGAFDLALVNAGSALTALATGLPVDGRPLYVRLNWLVGTWRSADYTYTAAPSSATAQMLAPAPMSTLRASRVPFQWTGGRGISEYYLWVGTTAGGSDLFNQDQGTNLGTTVAGLPVDGRTVYVRLWSLFGPAWLSRDYTYTATTSAPARAQLMSPAPGSTLSASTVPFQWTGGTGVSQYYLWVGTTDGGNDLVNRDAGTSLSATVTGLPTDGRTLHARMWSLIGGTWQSYAYTHTARATSAPGLAELTTPAPGSTLTAATVAFEWTGGTGVSHYYLWIGNAQGTSDIASQDRGTNLTGTVLGLPTDGRALYVRLWSLVGPAWQPHDYTYTAMSTSATPRAQMTTPAPGSTLPSSAVAFQWTGGKGVAQYVLWVGTTGAGSSNFGVQDRGTNLSATVTGLPTNGTTLFVRLWSLVGGGWQFNDYTYAAAASSAPPRAQMTTPASGSTLTASTVEFKWTGGAGVSQYYLWVGNGLGANDLAVQDRGTNLSAIVTGLPTDGRTLYVRLWSLIGGWQFYDYTYTAATGAAARGQMLTPAPGSTLAASTVMFQWTGGTGVTQYVLWVGTTGAGSSDLAIQDRGTNLSGTVTGLPTNGTTIYVRLWSLVGGAWQFYDYTYTAPSS